jgi:hypothetical protein
LHGIRWWQELLVFFDQRGVLGEAGFNPSLCCGFLTGLWRRKSYLKAGIEIGSF